MGIVMKEYNNETKTPQNEYVNRPTPLEALNKLLEILDYYKDKAQRNFQTIRIFSELPNYIKDIENALKNREIVIKNYENVYEILYNHNIKNLS